MMSWSPRCYMRSFVEIGPMLPEMILKGFYHNDMGMAAIFVVSDGL